MRVQLATCFVLGMVTLSLAQTEPALLQAQVIKDLASEDFDSRTAAQKALAQVGLEQRDGLQQLAAKAADPEVKARLFARIEELNVFEAIEGPGITLDVKDATPDELAGVLRRILGVSLETDPDKKDSPRFTLKVTDAHYWDLLDKLSQQHAVTITPIDRNESRWRMNVSITPAPKAENTRTFGGFRWTLKNPTAIEGIMRYAVVHESAGAFSSMGIYRTPVADISVQCNIEADPRLPVLDTILVVEPGLADEKGHPLKVAADMDKTTGGGTEASWSHRLSLRAAEGAASKIPILKARAKIRIDHGLQNVLIDRPADRLKEPIKVGSKTFTVTQFAETAQRIDYKVDATGDDFESCSICLIDKDGMRYHTAYTGQLNGTGTVVATGGAKLNGPFKLEITAPIRVQHVVVPLEWKDIPLPPLRE